MSYFKAAAEALWQLLDDIDTMDDMAKGDDVAYRRGVRKLHQQRASWATSPDGQILAWGLKWLPGDEPRSEDLHYAGAVRATVTRDGSGWRVTFPDGVFTPRHSLKAAQRCAENNVRVDAGLPRIPE